MNHFSTVLFLLLTPACVAASGITVFQDNFAGPPLTVTAPGFGFFDLQQQSGLPSDANTFGERSISAQRQGIGVATTTIDGAGILGFDIGSNSSFDPRFSTSSVRWGGFPELTLEFPYPEVDPPQQRLLEIDFLDLAFSSATGQSLASGELHITLQATSDDGVTIVGKVLGRDTVTTPILTPTTLTIPLMNHLRPVVNGFSLNFSTLQDEVVSARIDAIRVLQIPEPSTLAMLGLTIAVAGLGRRIGPPFL